MKMGLLSWTIGVRGRVHVCVKEGIFETSGRILEGGGYLRKF